MCVYIHKHIYVCIYNHCDKTQFTMINRHSAILHGNCGLVHLFAQRHKECIN